MIEISWLNPTAVVAHVDTCVSGCILGGPDDVVQPGERFALNFTTDGSDYRFRASFEGGYPHRRCFKLGFGTSDSGVVVDLTRVGTPC